MTDDMQRALYNSLSYTACTIDRRERTGAITADEMHEHLPLEDEGEPVAHPPEQWKRDLLKQLNNNAAKSHSTSSVAAIEFSMKILRTIHMVKVSN